jgi:hypothetical protein
MNLISQGKKMHKKSLYQYDKCQVDVNNEYRGELDTDTGCNETVYVGNIEIECCKITQFECLEEVKPYMILVIDEVGKEEKYMVLARNEKHLRRVLYPVVPYGGMTKFHILYGPLHKTFESIYKINIKEYQNG